MSDARCAALIAVVIGMGAGYLPTPGSGQGVAFGGVPASQPATVYQVEANGIVGHNLKRFYNRPLYGANLPAVLMAGDQPAMRFEHQPYRCGTLMIAFTRDGRTRWLHDCGDMITRYDPDHLQWTVRDPAWSGVSFDLQAVTVASGGGFTARLDVQGARKGDRIIWAYGATPRAGSEMSMWEIDPITHPQVTQQPFRPEDCKDNRVEIVGDAFKLFSPLPLSVKTPAKLVVVGKCSTGTLAQVNADAWADPTRLVQTPVRDMPIFCGTIELKENARPVYWLVKSDPTGNIDPASALQDPSAEFEAGLRRVQPIARQVETRTPDHRIDTAIRFLNAAIDGAWYPPVYVHGGLSWNIPFPGWRTVYGPTVLGWHDHVKQEGKFYIGFQTKDSPNKQCKAEPSLGLTIQAGDSRFYGRGRIQQDQQFYNFQEVFFDQMIHAWRWTGDAELEKVLRPALDLHLEWMHDCFDADGNGVYESYINVWASDSVWYNGGETTQSTAYAYRGHVAAAEMAERAGDAAAAAKHRERAEGILRHMKQSLWIPGKGLLAEYRESGPLHRPHDDACLYTICLPIDSGMMTPMETAQMIDYTERTLQRVSQPAGGEMCWTSNFVPYVWSVRELETGDTCHLALACYQGGLGEDGWRLLEGSFAQSMFNSLIPGTVGWGNGGMDFTDSTSMLARVIVEGMFGFKPDRPNHRVSWWPQFPRGWDHAAIRTPDAELSFDREGDVHTYNLRLKEPADAALTFPVRAHRIRSISLNGRPVKFTTEPGFEQTLVHLAAPGARELHVVMDVERARPGETSPIIRANIGQPLRWLCEDGSITAIDDPQAALTEHRLEGGSLKATLSANSGRHLVFARIKTGELEQWQRIKVDITDSEKARLDALQNPREAIGNARWTCINLDKVFNGDVRGIYKQNYLSPRPATCSVQLGTDGYSPWTFYFWQMKPPPIELEAVASLTGNDGLMKTPQGVRFAPPKGERNIAFTSQWDNWPRSVTVPVHQAGDIVWLLVAGSTNPMQTGIANGQVELQYTDGNTDTIELIPPANYWSLSAEYDYKTHGFALPQPPPPTVQLGKNCRAMVIGRKLNPKVELKNLTLETLSQEVVIGLMGVSIERK